MNDILKFEMIEAMKNHGGGFVQSLAECFACADATNFNKLCMAFPEYVEQYLARDAAQRRMHPTAAGGSAESGN